MRNGVCFQRPTPAPAIYGSGCSSSLGLLPTPQAEEGCHDDSPQPSLAETTALLKTPTAQLAVNGGSQHPDKRRAGGHGPTLADEVEHLLPTPTWADGDRSSATYVRGNPTLLGALLPTPGATDGNGGPREVPSRRTRRGKDHGPRLRDVAPLLPSTGDGTGFQSPDGKPSPGGPRHRQPALDEPESGLTPGSPSG